VTGPALTGWWGVVLETPDPDRLAHFYADLLGWRVTGSKPNWATINPPDEDSTAYMGFQRSPEYVPPVWPPADGKQQMMMHVDIGVTNLDTSVARATALGATLAGYQPQDEVRVMLDPHGHPFCLYLDL
jgi:catechol 2,3-dioxygenase-like lactoylglutathione lyase family enzyme